MHIKLLLASTLVFTLITPAAALDLMPAGAEVVFSANVIPTQMNADIPETFPAADVDEGAHFFRVAVQWPSTDGAAFGVSAVEYYAVVKGKNVLDVPDDYVESVDYVGVIYGNRYYLRGDHRGLNLGWYAGASSWSSEGYDYSGTTRFAGYSESGVSAVAAAELSYDLRLKLGDSALWMNPALVMTLDKDFGELEFWPTFELGMVF